MQALILVMIVAVTVFRYLVAEDWLPAFFAYVPELLSALAAVYVVMVGGENRFRYVRPVYWLVFFGLLVVIVCGVIVNTLSPGIVVAGLRSYLRAIPFFLLPAAFVLKEKQLRVQFLVLLVICIVQLPLAWEQRSEVKFLGGHTGDSTDGTIQGSSMLTMFLVSAACVLAGLYLRKRISAKLFLLALLWILLPTTLNETKATLILVPLAMFATFVAASERGVRVRNAVVGLAVSAAFIAIFIPIYDYYMVPRWGYGIMDFFTMEGRVEGYLIKDEQLGTTEQGGRLDGMIAGFELLSRDPAHLFFGLGVGNASPSSLGPQFTGHYAALFEVFRPNTLSTVLVELGVLGVALVLVLHWLIFLDALAVARSDRGIFGALAAGWVGVSVVMAIGLIYHATMTNLALTFLFWYFSGVVAAQRQRIAEETPARAPV